MTWDVINTASFMGLEFDVVSISDSLTRRLAQYKYPWRSGAELEDMGREPYSTQIEAIVEGPEYEQDLATLLDLFNEKTTGDFVHPILGQWKARIETLSIQHDASARDFASISMTIVEDGIDQEIISADAEAIQQLQAEVYEMADEMIYESMAFDETIIEDVSNAANEAKSFAEQVEDFVADVEARADEIRAKLNDAITAIETLSDPNKWPIVRAARRTADGILRLSNRVKTLVPRSKKKFIRAMQPLSSVVHSLYGNTDNMQEILDRNHLKNPFTIPTGTELTVYENARTRKQSYSKSSK